MRGRGRQGKGEGKRWFTFPNWGLWIQQWRRIRKGKEHGGEFRLGRPCTSFFHFKHYIYTDTY